MENYIKNIRKELKNYITKSNIKSLIIGISGGADSTLIALLAIPICDKLNIPLIGRSITIEGNKPEEIQRAKDIGKSFCNKFKEINLTKLYQDISYKFGYEDGEHTKKEKIRLGNIKARIRMIYLYNLASKYNGMVLSTDNYTEYLLGFWTMHGDVGSYSMIQEIWKTEVYGMLEYIQHNEVNTKKENRIITSIINADATDGLGITNTDLEQIMPEWKGTSKNGYAKVDKILKKYLDTGIIKNILVINRHIDTEFKRNDPNKISRNIILK